VIHRGLTLTELIVAISLFVLVLGLLGFPLYAAFGYIQKAIAQSEAQAAGKRAVKQLARELGDASTIFPLPPNGEWISFLPSDSSRAAFGNFAGTAVSVSFVRYSLVPDFPWIWDSLTDNFVLLQPNYSEAPAQIKYARHHIPFYSDNADGQRTNPYVLARYEQSNLAYGTAVNIALEPDSGSYPMNQQDYEDLAGNPVNQGMLLRKIRNELVAITPYGPDWDVSHFVVRPARMAMEGMRRSVTGSAVCTSVYSRYPLWAGRSRDLDENSSDLLDDLYYPVVDATALDPLQSLRNFIDGQFPLYRLYPNTADGPVESVNNTRNPFGYQVRVYDQSGFLRFGLVNASSSAVCERHFMDWPPIDRPDLATPDGAEFTFDDTHLAQWKADVERQRREGKLVFAQPMQSETLEKVDIGGNYYYTLPLPNSALPGYVTGWSDKYAYIVKKPATITWNGITFRLVDKDQSQLGTREFCFPYQTEGSVQRYGTELQWNLTESDPQFGLKTRAIVFGSDFTGSALSETVNRTSYTICDLQPTDTVVATYSTLGMLDIGLTLSRQDRSGGRRQHSRQDYTMNLRVEARNAMRRARQR
jgi:type II secretory pathway pseudopilin PulG